jgi:hypothetical protein
MKNAGMAKAVALLGHRSSSGIAGLMRNIEITGTPCPPTKRRTPRDARRHASKSPQPRVRGMLPERKSLPRQAGTAPQ